MRVNYYQSGRSRSRDGANSTGARVTTLKAIHPEKSKHPLTAKSGGLNLSSFAAPSLAGLPSGSATEAINGLAKIILDAGKSGRSIRNLKQRIEAIQAIAILILNAKSDVVDRLLGFDSTAGDGTSGESCPGAANGLPAEPAEGINQEVLTFHDLHLDVPRHKVTVENNPIKLTIKEFRLLTLLAQRRGRVQSRERLLEDVWEYNCSLDTRTVDTHIRRLRQKLGPARKYIETVNGIGYRFLEI